MEPTLTLFFTTLMIFGTSGVQAQQLSNTNTTVNITRAGCGSTKLCVQTPNACDPTGSSSCLFGSSTVKNATTNDFSFQLSGITTSGNTTSGNTTTGSATFIALELSTTTGGSIFFACIQFNSSFGFLTVVNNTAGNLTTSNRTVTQIRGQVDTTKIQCEFDVPNLTVSSSNLRSLDNTFGFSLLSGTGASVESLTFSQTFRAGQLDLSNPSANVANTTTAPNTTAVSNTTVSRTNRALHSEGVLLLTGILSLAFLKTP